MPLGRGSGFPLTQRVVRRRNSLAPRGCLDRVVPVVGGDGGAQEARRVRDRLEGQGADARGAEARHRAERAVPEVRSDLVDTGAQMRLR